MSKTAIRIRRNASFRRLLQLLLGMFLQLGWVLPTIAQTEYWGPPYDNGWDGKDNYPSAGAAVQAYIAEVQDSCNTLQAPSTCVYRVETKDPNTNGGWAAWVWTDVYHPDGSVSPGTFPDYVNATSHSNDVTKNIGGPTVCICQKTGEGSSAASSSARGSSGDNALDNQSIGPFSVLESDPINTATGNKFQQDTDFRGSSWLTFRRFYNSIGYVSQSTLGPQWRHSFDRSLEIIQLYGDTHASTVYLYRPDASREHFIYAGGAWVADADTPDRLTEQGEFRRNDHRLHSDDSRA